ncbi:MAG TPA: TlpA disulfide reductase family protein [Bryobacterales bacterium]|nr:TlpA disulfide reductase family protein [Bryobacterales bacterium]
MLRSFSFFRPALFAIALAGLAIAGDVPRPAPPLDLPTPEGGHISLRDLRGKVVLLEFFLTECPHCQRTAGDIGPIYKEMRSRGLEVLAVAINPDAKQRVGLFRQRFNATYPIGLGTDTLVRQFADISAVRQFFVPYIFILDRKGIIRHEHPGTEAEFYTNEAANLRAELDALLKEPATSRRSAHKSTARKSAPKS